MFELKPHQTHFTQSNNCTGINSKENALGFLLSAIFPVHSATPFSILFRSVENISFWDGIIVSNSKEMISCKSITSHRKLANFAEKNVETRIIDRRNESHSRLIIELLICLFTSFSFQFLAVNLQRWSKWNGKRTSMSWLWHEVSCRCCLHQKFHFPLAICFEWHCWFPFPKIFSFSADFSPCASRCSPIFAGSLRASKNISTLGSIT